MSFFYDLNKKLDSIRATPEVTHKQLNERDMGKHNNATTGFKAVADKAAKEYGSKAAGERVAGAQFQKMKKSGKLEEEGKALDPVRKKHNKYDNKEVDEGVMDTVKSVGKKVASGVNRLVGHGSDEEMRKDVQRKSGAPVTGKKPSAAPKQTPIDPKDEYDYFTGRDKVRGGEQQQKKPNLPEMDSSDAASDAREAMAKQIYDLTMLINTNDKMYAQDSPQDTAKLQKLQAEFSRLYPGEDGFKVGSGFHNSEYERGQRQKQRQPAAPKPTGIMQKAKNAMSGMFKEDDMPMTATGKKLNFADKIANAKKEVDEMLGDVAAEAMRSALSPKQKKIAGMAGDPNEIGADDLAALRKGRNAEMDEERSKGTAFDMSTQRVDTPKAGSTERGAKHDIKHSTSDPRYTGRTVTRRTDAQGISVGADDDADTQAGPRGRGRPKGTKGAIGAKGPSGRSKLMTREGEVDIRDQGEYDQEGDMAKDDIKTIVRHAQALSKVLGDNDNLPEWVQSKLAKIEGMMISIDEYMQNQEGDDEMSMGEEKTSTRDDRAEKAGKKVTKDIEYDEKKKDGIHGKKRGPEDDKAEKAGKKVTKDIEHDEKKKKKDEEVDESTTSGSVATSTTGGNGGVYGKGIYDSMNRELENMIAESMTINMSDSTEGGKSLTITATDEDALKLGMLLKNAGLGGGDTHGGDMHSHGEEPCDTCGMQDCGCGDVQEAVDENAPDWPTNTETSPDALQYSGGLNKPKTDVAGDGQTTIPNSAVHTQDEDALRRMMEMAGIKQAELEPWKETMKEDAEEDATDAENAVNDAEAAEDEIQESFAESIQRMREIAGIKEAKKQVDQNGDGKNDFEDIKIARMKASGAIDDKEEKKVDESIFSLTNQWRAYKG
jgi:hypothetical protein